MAERLIRIMMLLVFATAAFAQTSAPPVTDEPLEVWVRQAEGAGLVTYQEMVDKYTAETGQEINLFGTVTDFEERLLRSAAGGSLPDLIINDTAGRGQLIELGLVQPVERSQVPGNEDILERAWAAAQGADGRYYGVPTSTQAFELYIRSDWREAVGHDIPQSYDDIVDLAVAFTTEDPDGNGQNDTYGFVVPASTTRGYASWFWQSFLWGFGGDYMVPADDGKFTPTLDTEEAEAALIWLKDMFCEYNVVQPGAINAVTADAHPAFRSGQAGMYFTGPYMIGNFDETVGEANFEVVQLPPGPVNNAVLAEGENAYIMTGTDKYDQAIAFAAWIASPDGQVAGMVPEQGTNPVVRLPVNMNVEAGVVYDDPRWVVVQEAFATAGRYVQPVPNWSPFRMMVSETVNAALADCNSDVAALLAEANERVAAELESQGVLANP